MQIRLLADLCFIFGLYSYAYQLYQTVRKEFAVDQAWLYNAGALVSDSYFFKEILNQIRNQFFLKCFSDNR